MDNRLHIYAGDALAAYGWDEKPWYLPGQRMAAFLAAMRSEGLLDRIALAEAGAATDEELALFHTPDHVSSVRERCARNAGSLDDIAAPILREAERIVRFVQDRPGPRAALAEAVPTVHLPLQTYLTYLANEGLLEGDDEVRLAPAAAAWLADPGRRLSGPTPARAGVERAATYVAGAALDATRRILRGDIQRAFLPIGGYHHAHRDEARMYCLYNDPALAIALALQQIDGTVAYIDIDIHQGDGVYEAFAAEPRVAIADLHQDWSTLFPYAPEAPGPDPVPGRREANGRGRGAGSKLNLPLAPATTDDAYLALWAEAEAFVRAARPSFVVFEAGVDGLAGDPSSRQQLTPKGLVEVSRRVRAVADEVADGRLLAFGGGGYDPETVGTAWTALAETLV